MQENPRFVPRPKLNTVWAWHPFRLFTARLVAVTDVRWDGRDWKVVIRPVRMQDGTDRTTYTASDFWKSAHAVSVKPGPR